MIQSVKKTFDILEYMAANGNLVRLQDIAEALCIQPTTVHNFLASLKQLGYIEQDELTPRYRLTAKINTLDFSRASIHKLRSDFRPLLETLAEQTGETAYLAVQMGSYFRYEWICEPNRTIRISLDMGREYEMQHTAIGKLFMAYSPQLASVIQRNLDSETITKQQVELSQIVANGYALDLEEYEKELHCVAVPYLCSGRVVAVIGLSGPAYRFDVTRLHQSAEIIRNALRSLHK